jgi:hypothetical protein
MNWHVDRRKLLDYLLSGTSVFGAAKNRFFRALGFHPDTWEVFQDALVPPLYTYLQITPSLLTGRTCSMASMIRGDLVGKGVRPDAGKRSFAC